jgi:hypothetical protein
VPDRSLCIDVVILAWHMQAEELAKLLEVPGNSSSHGALAKTLGKGPLIALVVLGDNSLAK